MCSCDLFLDAKTVLFATGFGPDPGGQELNWRNSHNHETRRPDGVSWDGVGILPGVGGGPRPTRGRNITPILPDTEQATK